MRGVSCAVSAADLLKIKEALCSFLQAENVGNFQTLQPWSFLIYIGFFKKVEDRHSGFTRKRGTALNTIFTFLGDSYDPQLEDGNIQFHASRINTNAKLAKGSLWGWENMEDMYNE